MKLEKLKTKPKEIRELFDEGGIRGRMMQLILFSLIILGLSFLAMSVFQSRILSKQVRETSEKQQLAISETADDIMDEVVTQNLKRSNRMEVKVAEGMFDSVRDRLTFLSEYASDMFSNPSAYGYGSYSLPDPADDGKWTAKVIYADDANPSSSALKRKLGLLANMTDMMIDLCTSYGAANVYIGVPEGAHFSVSDNSSSWYEDGVLKSYDPRTRDWYQKASEEGKLVFTDGEWDANTGAYCIECAVPVYDSNNELQAVIGADLYLDEMQKVLDEAAIDGEFCLIVNQNGNAVLAPQAESFPMSDADRDGDIRKSQNQAFAKIASDALSGKDVGVQLIELEGNKYYITASKIETMGWVLISAYSQETTGEATTILNEKLDTIQEESTDTYQKKIGRYKGASLVIILALMTLILWAASIYGRRIVDPLNTITERISELGESDLEFRMEDEYRTGDEVEKLAESFAALSHKTIEYMNEVVAVTAEKERIGAELSLATEIQSSMLPHIFPAFPHRKDFDIYASMDPAKEVGGDFYDYFFIDDDHLALLIADVSGKGVPAALFMMASKIILQGIAGVEHSPKVILEKVNEILCSNNEAEMFVSVWLGILDTRTGRLTASNAGHEYPVVRKPDGEFELLRDKHGFVLGVMDGIKQKEYELTLEKGSKIFVYTDGVPEATNSQEEMFGTDRLVDALNRDPEASPEDILKNVREAVDGFVKDAEQFDDLTMLCLEYVGQEGTDG